MSTILKEIHIYYVIHRKTLEGNAHTVVISGDDHS